MHCKVSRLRTCITQSVTYMNTRLEATTCLERYICLNSIPLEISESKNTYPADITSHDCQIKNRNCAKTLHATEEVIEMTQLDANLGSLKCKEEANLCMRRGLDTCRATNLAAALIREDVKHTEKHNSSCNIRQRIYLVIGKQKNIIIAQIRNSRKRKAAFDYIASICMPH